MLRKGGLDAFKIKLTDLEWAGTEGKATYPLNMAGSCLVAKSQLLFRCSCRQCCSSLQQGLKRLQGGGLTLGDGFTLKM